MADKVTNLLESCPTKVKRAAYEAESRRWESKLKETIDALAEIGTPTALSAIERVQKNLEADLLKQAKKDPYIFNRRDAIYALGHIRSQKAVPFLKTMLLDWLHYESFSDSGECLRTAAAYALGRIEDATTVPTLVASLELDKIDVNPHEYIARGLSVRGGLQQCGSPFAMSIIEKHDKGDIEYNALRSLLEEVSDENRYKRIAPLEHARQLGGEELLEDRSCAYMAREARKMLKALGEG